jgi:predicted DCC family thiol-disulfide oxidoreductase YuxK
MSPAVQFADPDDNRQADVVIYDGKCQFCQSQVARLERLDRAFPARDGLPRLAFLSLHDARVASRYPELSFEQLMEQMYVIERGQANSNGIHGGADAVRYLSRRLPILWPVAPLLHLPGTARLWRWAYHQVAKRRYRWNRDRAGTSNTSGACKDDACAVHFGEHKFASPRKDVVETVNANIDP